VCTAGQGSAVLIRCWTEVLHERNLKASSATHSWPSTQHELLQLPASSRIMPEIARLARRRNRTDRGGIWLAQLFVWFSAALCSVANCEQLCGEHGLTVGGWCRCVDGAVAVNMSRHPLAVGACGRSKTGALTKHHHLYLSGHCACVKIKDVPSVVPSTRCGESGRPNTVVVGQ
jgi:hypothetical protein